MSSSILSRVVAITIIRMSTIPQLLYNATKPVECGGVVALCYKGGSKSHHHIRMFI